MKDPTPPQPEEVKKKSTRKIKLEKLKKESEQPKQIKKKEVRAGYEYDVDV